MAGKWTKNLKISNNFIKEVSTVKKVDVFEILRNQMDFIGKPMKPIGKPKEPVGKKYVFANRWSGLITPPPPSAVH